MRRLNIILTEVLIGLLIIAAIVAMLWSIGAATAQSPTTELPCGSRAELAKMLQEDHGESLAMMGVTGTGTALLEVWGTPDWHTWSILIGGVNKDGKMIACIVAAGEDMQIMPMKPGNAL